MPAPVDISGQRFGRLVVLSRAASKGRGRTAWTVRCECGTTLDVATRELRQNKTRSCGCLKLEAVVELGRRNRRHGRRYTPEYRAWASIINRCENPNATHFEYWGGRGIKMCERWRESFEAFFEDVGLRPSPQHSIDRIDPNGHYEPGNVRWATDTEQQHNRRDNFVIEAMGKTRTALEWSAETGIAVDTMILRLKRGWSPERVVSVRPS